MNTTRFLTAGLLLAALLTIACGGKAPFYRAGDPIQTKRATTIDDVLDDPRSFADQVVLVEGRVKEVCQGMGCWALIEDPKSGNTLYTRSPGDVILLPTTCTGSDIRVEGRFVYEEQPGHAGCAAHLGEEADHSCPQPTYFVTLAAVELRQR